MSIGQTKVPCTFIIAEKQSKADLTAFQIKKTRAKEDFDMVVPFMQPILTPSFDTGRSEWNPLARVNVP
jgi:hypothetical protein